MNRKDFYAQDDDGYAGNNGSDDSENYPNSADYDDDNHDPNIDSDAINDFTSQELDKRIQQMKAKIKDLQEDELDYQRSSEKPVHSGNKKDYTPNEEDSEAYYSPEDFAKQGKSQNRELDQDSMENSDIEDDDVNNEKERLKDKIENIKKAIQQYNSDDNDEKLEDSKISGRYYEEDDNYQAYDYSQQQKPHKKQLKSTPPRKKWNDTEQEDNLKSKLAVNY